MFLVLVIINVAHSVDSTHISSKVNHALLNNTDYLVIVVVVVISLGPKVLIVL